MDENTLSARVDPADRRAFVAIARAAERTPSQELRRIVRLYVRGQLQERRPADPRPADGGAHE